MQPKIDMLQEDTETVINYSKYQIGDWAEVYTTDKNVMKRHEKWCNKYPEYGRVIKEDKYSMTFSEHPKYAALYPRTPRKSQPITEERKAALDAQLARGRQKQAEKRNA